MTIVKWKLVCDDCGVEITERKKNLFSDFTFCNDCSSLRKTVWGEEDSKNKEILIECWRLIREYRYCSL